MLIDLLLLILAVFAIIKGFSRGLIVGIFSLLAIIIGLAAAMKLSLVVAGWLGESVNVSERWLPVISFLVVFIGVILLVRLGAKALEKGVELVTLGWLNKLGGIILYLVIYITVFSVLLFYAGQLGLISEKMMEESVTYKYISPWGPKAIELIGYILPFFRDMFAELEEFFGGVSQKVSTDN